MYIDIIASVKNLEHLNGYPSHQKVQSSVYQSKTYIFTFEK